MRQSPVSKLSIEQTNLAGVLIITPARFGDGRGYFSESWNMASMAEHGITETFVQDNHSLSVRAGTIRGLHYQTPPHAQAKLVRCGRGALFDVAVDIRRGSPTFGQWAGAKLSAENGRQMLVPKGFAHGFLTLTDDTEIIYKCSDYYAPGCDRALRFDDPEIGIDWGIGREDVLLSEKDETAPALCALETPFVWEAGA